MRPFGIGLAAALAIAALAPAALSQAKKAEEIPAKSRTQGMAEAPAAAKAAGIACNVTDARWIGKQEDKKAKTSSTFYEIDCDQGVGFVLQAASTGATTSFTCIEANAAGPDGKPSTLACKLPGNADPKADLAPLLAAAKVSCTPEQARGIGQSATNTFIEVACQGSSLGYVLKASAPLDAAKPVEATDCMLYDQGEGNIKCTLRDAASRLAVVDALAAQANVGCTVKERKFVGMSTTGATFFEASCQDGKGYMLKTEGGKFSQSIECAKAQTIMGGCTLTDARQAVTEQNGLYTKLAKAAGYDCDVSKYAPFPGPPGKEVVELACNNRPDGAVAIFGGPKDKAAIYDCARASVALYRCSFSKPDTAYRFVTADLKKLGKTECEVSNTRFIGRTQKGTGYLEVACADGLKGYILEYTHEPLAAVSVIGCAFSKDCKLPGNS